MNPDTVSEGRALTSRYRGVCWDKGKARWRASIRHDGRQHFVGLFENERAAAAAYDAKAKELRGERARLNFPPVVQDQDGMRRLDRRPREGIALVPLDDDGSVMATVDLDDADRVQLHTWSRGAKTKDGTPTPVTSIRGRSVALGRFLLDAIPGERVVYADGNPLNCRRENLSKTGRGRAPYEFWAGGQERLLVVRDELVAQESRLVAKLDRVRQRRKQIEDQLVYPET